MRPGRDAALVGCSAILEECLAAEEQLEKTGVSVSVINASTLSVADDGCLLRLRDAGIPVITVEEHTFTGGLGALTAQRCAGLGIPGPRRMLSLPDDFIAHGSRRQLLARYGLTAEGIARQVREALGR